MAQRLSDEWCREHFDHLSPDLAATLPETMARVRALNPVARSDAHGGFWAVTDYRNAMAVARTPEVYSSAHGLSIVGGGGVVKNRPVELDGAEQRLYKNLTSPFFTPAAMAPLEAPVRDLVNRLIDGFADRGECEFMGEFARPLPSLAFFELVISAPAEEVETVAALASTSSTPTHPKARESWKGLYDWVGAFVRTRRENPAHGDVVDAVLAAQIDGRPITDEEAIGTIQLLILGGLETTAGALGLILIRLCREPHIADRLRAHPELLPAAVEELLRLEGPFVSVGRTAVAEAELAGEKVAEGDKVLIHWASANRDAAEFPEPDEFRLDREHNRHLAFGIGPHRCTGANLARMNIRIALEELLRRIDTITLKDESAIHYHAGLTRSPLSLPITFTLR
ncbi:cytochrome P450 [Cryptosporangium aurantiacum]|uniref:Cytochrome P450 n=1 Tax=Cryptosporangium aurantiacum TaxID=134849 RepID=A0A1M7KI76_9ACTN|nr:cytochrome P450 [Cryptosporangium aurantiacum]SHM65031.1 Cytochrome P450 [Cryptosporangium aurantiacum]